MKTFLEKLYNFREKAEAENITAANLALLFFFGSITGFILEGIWCIITEGGWQNHSATVWGPFCIIYGLGAVTMFMVSVLVAKKNPGIQFLVFALVGAGVEYFGSVFQEVFLGSSSWNYDDHFMNLNGRISLQMTFIWGVLGFAFCRLVFPWLNILFGKLNNNIVKTTALFLVAFLFADMIFTAVAINRWHKRAKNIPAGNPVEEYVDSEFGDERMEKIFPNLSFTDK